MTRPRSASGAGDRPATAELRGCTDEHAKFCSQCTTARLYNTIHCQDCGEGRPSAATTTAARLPRIWEGWPDDLAGILREAAKRLEQAPWLKPIEGMRLWADALDYERQIREAEVRDAD